MIIESDAIVLQVRKYGDTSKIAVVFTKQLGKISIIAKGAFSTKNKFGAALEPLAYTHISFYQNSSSLHLLKNIEIVEPFNKISKNYEPLIAGFIATEFVNSVQQEYQMNIDIFHGFVQYLQNLNQKPDNSFDFTIIFLLKLSTFIGYSLDFAFVDKLADDQMAIKISLEDAQPVFFTNSSSYYKIRMNLLKIIYNYSQYEYENFGTSVLNVHEFKIIVNFFSAFFSFHLGKKIAIKSVDLLV